MSEIVQLHAKDGHTLDAYAAQPGVTARGGLVIVQEIYGVNAHIRAVAERYAEDGYVTDAPALFDRIELGLELGYGEQEKQRAMQLAGKFDLDKGVMDIAAAVEWLRGFGLKGAAWWDSVSVVRLPGSALRGCQSRLLWATTAARLRIISANVPRFRPCCTSESRIRAFRRAMWTKSPQRTAT